MKTATATTVNITVNNKKFVILKGKHNRTDSQDSYFAYFANDNGGCGDYITVAKNYIAAREAIAKAAK